MNKLKTILIISGIVLGAGIFANVASAAGLSVQFQNSPLFNETGFAPGNTTTEWVKVGNTSGSTQKIVVEAINKNDADNFSGQLNLVIKEGGTELFNDTLKKFFDAGEQYLSDLANNGNTQYDFSITFNADANGDWQGKTVGFDIVIGFQGQEGQSSGGGGNGGGGTPGPSALSIYSEANVVSSDTSVTITWTTSYAATSQVIYGTATEAHTLSLSDNLETPPLYGYAHTTPETDLGKVINHTVTITGLTPGTTYYYRAVSHGSLAIGQEFTFTTLGTSPINLQTGTTTTPGTGVVAGAETENPTGNVSTNKNGTPAIENVASSQEQSTQSKQSAVTENTPSPSLLATIFNFSTFGKGIRTIIIVALVALVIYLIIIFFKKRKKKDKVQENPNLKDGHWK